MMNCPMVKYSLFFLGLFFLQACTAPGYYTQGIIGHTSLMLSRKPVDKVVKTADEKLKKKLLLSQDIRDFSIDALSLPDNKSYRSYVELKNSSPVWNVVAAEEFSLRPKTWCYLVIGCASYRGYYKKESAENYANKLKQKGYDVRVAGVGAYSTLGFFADPLTSTMLKRDEASLAELIFHELSHQKLYIKNNTRFNEAFATVVGEQGAILWMKNNNKEELLNNYKQRLSVQMDFIGLVNNTKEKLKILYKTTLPDDIKREKKLLIFKEMKEEYKDIRDNKWGGRAWYGRWFSAPLNNAHLVSIATYHDLVPNFEALFERCDRDFARFYQQVKVNSKTKGNIILSQCDPNI